MKLRIAQPYPTTKYVDLDGTLAKYDRWRGKEHIGDPVPLMLERIQSWLEDGIPVKIFTARANDPEAIPFVERWLEVQGIGGLEVTNLKGFDALEFWDDRGRQVVLNTGELIE